MSGVKKVSNSSRDRIRNMYVDRKTAINRIGQVRPVEPVNPVDNSTSTATANYMLYSELFYDTLNSLKEEYKRFYHTQRELEEAIKEFSEDPSSLYGHMDSLIQKYNNAMEALHGFDHLFHTNHHKKVIDVIKKYKKQLKSIGIYISEKGYFQLDQEKLMQQMDILESPLDFIINRENGLMTELYRIFRNIQVPSHQYFQKGNYEEDTMVRDYIGLLMDKQS